VKTGACNGLVTSALSAETEVSVGAGVATAAGAAGAATVGGLFVGAGVGAVVGAGVGSNAVWPGRTVGSLRTVGVGGGCAGVAGGGSFSGEGSASTEAIMLS